MFISATVAALAVQPAAADEIVAMGRIGHAIAIAGPDSLDHYTLKVDIADLNPATPAGWEAMSQRTRMGTALLCDQAAPQPYAGYFYREQRDCLRDSTTAAEEQMARARDLARAGTPVAVLNLRR